MIFISILQFYNFFLTLFYYISFYSNLQDLFNVLEPPRILLSSGCPVSKKYKTSDYLDPDNNDYDDN